MTINFHSLSRRKDPASPTSITKTRPTHFPPAPFQSRTQTHTNPDAESLPHLSPDSDPFARHQTAGQKASIYDTFVSGRPSFDPYSTRTTTLEPSLTSGSKRRSATFTPTGVNVISPTVVIPPRPYHSRSSSQSQFQSQHHLLSPTSNHPNMRPSPSNPSPMNLPPEIWDTPQPHTSHRYPSRRGGILDDMPEGIEDDAIHGLTPGSGMLSPNQSSVSVSKMKADGILGLETGAKLASFYLVSGLPKEYPAWSFADTDATQGLQPIEDSLGLWWRPDVLASAYSGQNTEDFLKEVARRRKGSKASTTAPSLFSPFGGASTRGIHVPDAGVEGAKRLMSKTVKYAHPRDVEVVNSTLAPPTTCHAFTFTIPKQDTISGMGRTRLIPPTPSPGPNYDAQNYGRQSMLSTVEDSPQQPPPRGVPARTIRNSASPAEIAYHGVTLTVWTHADPYRSGILKEIKARARSSKAPLDSLRSNPLPSTLGNGKKSVGGRRGLPFGLARQHSETDMTASETEAGMSDSDMEGPLGTRAMRGMGMSVVDCLPADAAAVFEDGGDVYWMPYAITMVSRHPIYDALQDFLRLSWARYSKNAKHHMTQVCRVLNYEIPRPGEGYRIQLSNGRDEPVTVEGVFPGALDFERGLVKVDFQMWPLFQALDIDHILTCAEIALSNSGRIVFCSKHPAMLNIAVNTLKYIVDLRGWAGIFLPIIHARDMNFIIEDPGPFIIGMSTECRYMVTIPSEIVLIDIDSNSLMCRSPPAGASSPRPKREKSKLKIFAALGNQYSLDRSIPMEFKVSYPKGTFRNFNTNHYNETQRPSYLGDRVRPPGWWKQAEVIAAFDKILVDRKPSLIQRLTKVGVTRQQAQLTMGEQLAKSMMRKRALHYVATRDDLEVKVARINRRLLRLVAEGDRWRSQFEVFEKYADKLAQEANELKTKIERERREAKRLSSIATEQSKTNSELEEKLRHTENARAEAMRQLSDMHQSIQELEREREEIMNVVEAQINNALEHAIDDESSTRPNTPTESVLSSPRSRVTVGDQDGLGRLRPYTRESGRSGLSRFTTDSAAVSVLGAVRGEVAKKVRPGTSGSEGIALRMQCLQQKLEMALSNVTTTNNTNTHQRPSSVVSNATDNDTGDHSQGLGLETNITSPNPDDDRRDSTAYTTIETPMGPRRPSTTALPTIIPATPHDKPISPMTVSNPDESSEVEIPRSTPSPLPSCSEGGSDMTQRERKVSSSTLGLRKPGVALRIKRRDREVGVGAGSVEGMGVGHEKGGSGVTESSSGGSEILVSPAASGFVGLESKEMGKGGDVVEGEKEEEEMKRLSTCTVAFGD